VIFSEYKIRWNAAGAIFYYFFTCTLAIMNHLNSGCNLTKKKDWIQQLYINNTRWHFLLGSVKATNTDIQLTPRTYDNFFSLC
jgi:hypothetical protein